MSTELALSGGAMNAKTVSEALSPGMEDLLLKATSAEEATTAILADPNLMREAKDIVGLVERLGASATKADLMRLYSPLLVLYGPPDYGSGQAGDDLVDAWWEIHAKAMKDIPCEAIAEAVDWWVAHGRPHMPQPADLVKLCEGSATEIRLILHRLRKAAAASVAEVRAEKTDEERAKVAEIHAELRAKLGQPRETNVVSLADQHRVAANLRRIAGRS